MPNKKLHLAVTPGDPRGIGPEILSLAAQRGKIPTDLELHIFASAEALKRSGFKSETRFHLYPAPENQSPGYQAGWAITKAVEVILDPQHPAEALVTGPIDKSALKEAGFSFDGHTEMLASLSQSKPVTMMLANDQLKVALVTTHVGLSQVSSALTVEKLLIAFNNTVDFIEKQLGEKNPRIAVLGLNPHAGEKGYFGREELDLIEPTLKAAAVKCPRVQISGPHPADTFFALELTKPKELRHHAVLAMYHDQGLIPVKLVDFPQTVNITLGLPFVRTSVDHGTAFDIAGQNKADPSSFIAALKWAKKLVRP